MWSKNSLSTKIILMVEGILLISSILFCTVSLYRARVGIRRAIQQRMLDIANCASGSVSGDVLQNLTEEDVGTPKYNQVYDTLAVFRDNVELEYVYCIRKVSEKNFIFTMDLDLYTPAGFGDKVKYTEALASAGRGKAAVDEVPYTDAWGRFYSAYSPVFASSGEVAGIIAVDFSSDWFEAQLSAQTRSTIFSYLIILLFSLLVAAFLSLITVRPFVQMQGKLLEEKVSAESANRAKSDFLANMSHEIRTPINAILGINEMILREDRHARELPETDTRVMSEALKNISVYAADVENAGHNLLTIVNDILDFSRIESGIMELTQNPYQLSSLLNDVSSMIHYKAKDKGLEFLIDVDETLPDGLCGDVARIRQILINILNNAVKYTERGTVRLTLRGQRQKAQMLLLTAAVQDTGIGIRQEDLKKLFTRFQRLEMERNSTVEGTGLGLVITKRLLEMMDGTITVESEYAKGSVFTVTIPQKIVSDVPVGDFQKRFEETVRDTAVYRESFHAPTGRILIVDDTKMNLTVAVSLLKSTQLQIDTASGGADAVALSKKNAYDVIFMDQRMPEMDGTEALHRIRALEGSPCREVPVICLTADAVIGAKERYLAEGFSDYLAKPIDSHALEKMLLKYLPKEKVEYVNEEQTAAALPETEPLEEAFLALHAAGIESHTGLRYCGNERAFYCSLLREYAQDMPAKTEKLQSCFRARNWKDYAVYVHALKSTSGMIGALKLSGQAAELEKAANAGDDAVILSEHAKLIEAYEIAVRAINTVFPEETGALRDNDILEFSPGEDEVLEFLPEEE